MAFKTAFSTRRPFSPSTTWVPERPWGEKVYLKRNSRLILPGRFQLKTLVVQVLDRFFFFSVLMWCLRCLSYWSFLSFQSNPIELRYHELHIRVWLALPESTWRYHRAPPKITRRMHFKDCDYKTYDFVSSRSFLLNFVLARIECSRSLLSLISSPSCQHQEHGNKVWASHDRLGTSRIQYKISHTNSIIQELCTCTVGLW